MTELEMNPDVQAEDFTEELSDEARDRAEEGLCACCNGAVAPVAD